MHRGLRGPREGRLQARARGIDEDDGEGYVPASWRVATWAGRSGGLPAQCSHPTKLHPLSRSPSCKGRRSPIRRPGRTASCTALRPRGLPFVHFRGLRTKNAAQRLHGLPSRVTVITQIGLEGRGHNGPPLSRRAPGPRFACHRHCSARAAHGESGSHDIVSWVRPHPIQFLTIPHAPSSLVTKDGIEQTPGEFLGIFQAG
jgi:hypothetical protein